MQESQTLVELRVRLARIRLGNVLVSPFLALVFLLDEPLDCFLDERLDRFLDDRLDRFLDELLYFRDDLLC